MNTTIPTDRHKHRRFLAEIISHGLWLYFRPASASAMSKSSCSPAGSLWRMKRSVNGIRYDLWRAVGQGGNILDILVQRGRDKTAEKQFFRKRLKDLSYVPRVSITDQLRSYDAATRESLPSIEPQQHRSPEQPGGKLPPTDTAARATHAGIQGTRAGLALPRRL
jgi:hypothetical protein